MNKEFTFLLPDTQPSEVKEAGDEYQFCPHDETDHGICLSCSKQTDMNAHDYDDE